MKVLKKLPLSVIAIGWIVPGKASEKSLLDKFNSGMTFSAEKILFVSHILDLSNRISSILLTSFRQFLKDLTYIAVLNEP